MTSETVLETRGLTKRFGGLVATDNVSLKVTRGARHALIGPNGAGKTTLVNQLTGVLAPTSGQILLEGQDITHVKPEARVKRGLVRTFQINQLFPTLTPLEAIALTIGERRGTGAKLWSPVGRNSDIIAEAEAVAGTFRLGDVLETRTSELPYGKQRLLEIALAVAARPRVLLLDEPAAGVPEADRHDLLATIAALPADVTVVLIEHDMDIVFRFADRITVLVNGAVFADGEPKAVAADPRVKAVYLGEAAHG
jgi:ABC-type branched-subunit amino acid transport system ATPase component